MYKNVKAEKSLNRTNLDTIFCRNIILQKIQIFTKIAAASVAINVCPQNAPKRKIFLNFVSCEGSGDGFQKKMGIRAQQNVSNLGQERQNFFCHHEQLFKLLRNLFSTVIAFTGGLPMPKHSR